MCIYVYNQPMYTRRNFVLGVVNGVLFIVAETLLDPTLVIVGFVSHLTQSPILLGLVIPIHDGVWALPQLWVSGFLQSWPRKLGLYRGTGFVRISCWLTLAVVMVLVSQPGWLLTLFFLVFSVGMLASGLGGLPFMEVVGKTVSPGRRGEFFAWRFGLGGLLGIGASALVSWLLAPTAPLAFPHNFGLLAFLYWVFASISVLSFDQVEEQPGTTIQPRASVVAQLTRARQFLRRDPDYRRLILMMSLLILAGSATPFFAVYVQQKLGGSRQMIGVYLAVMIGANLLANLVFGRISRRYGNQRVVNIALMAGISMSLLVLALVLLAGPLKLSGQAASYWLVPVFIFSALRGTGIGIAGNSLILDMAPETERSLYLGFYNTFLGVVMLAGMVSGLVVSAFGLTTLLILTLLAHLLAAWTASHITGRTFPVPAD